MFASYVVRNTLCLGHKTNRLMLYRKTTVVYYVNYKERMEINTVYDNMQVFLDVQRTGVTYMYEWAING
jgi:hypothetical protein